MLTRSSERIGIEYTGIEKMYGTLRVPKRNHFICTKFLWEKSVEG